MAKKRHIVRTRTTDDRIIDVPMDLADLDTRVFANLTDCEILGPTAYSSFAANWQQYGSWELVRLHKIKLGGKEFVVGQGLIQNTLAGRAPGPAVLVATMPAGYAPSVGLLRDGLAQTGAGTSAVCRLTINTIGQLFYEEGPVLAVNDWIHGFFMYFR